MNTELIRIIYTKQNQNSGFELEGTLNMNGDFVAAMFEEEINDFLLKKHSRKVNGMYNVTVLLEYEEKSSDFKEEREGSPFTLSKMKMLDSQILKLSNHELTRARYRQEGKKKTLDLLERVNFDGEWLPEPSNKEINRVIKKIENKNKSKDGSYIVTLHVKYTYKESGSNSLNPSQKILTRSSYTVLNTREI